MGSWMYWPVYATGGVLLALLLRRVPRRLAQLGWPVAVSAGAVIAAYAAALLSLNNPVERVHYLQYGLLSYTMYRSLRIRLPNWLVFFWSTGVVFFIGVVDETIQWVLPQRVGEYRDILINGVAALLIQLLLALALRVPELSGHPTMRQLRITLAATLVAAWPIAGFLLRAHSFGFLIQSPNGGGFTSLLPESELRAISEPEYQRWRKAGAAEPLPLWLSLNAAVTPGHPFVMPAFSMNFLHGTKFLGKDDRRLYKNFYFEGRAHAEAADWLALRSLDYSSVAPGLPLPLTVTEMIRRDWLLTRAQQEEAIFQHFYAPVRQLDGPFHHAQMSEWIESGGRLAPYATGLMSPVHLTNDWISDREGNSLPIFRSLTRGHVWLALVLFEVLVLAIWIGLEYSAGTRSERTENAH